MSQLNHWQTAQPIVQAHTRDLQQLARPAVMVEGTAYGQPAADKPHVPPFKRLLLMLILILRR
jgi:hypothetical protein